MTWFGAEVNVGLADCRPTYILAASGIGAVVLAAVFVIGMSAGRPG